MLTIRQINDIKNAVEAVTAQYFDIRYDQKNDDAVVFELSNQTRISYLFALKKINYNTLKLDLAIRRYKEITDTLSKILPDGEARRLIENPRFLCAVWLQQASYHKTKPE